MVYKNYKGQSTNFNEVSQEHLSNIYWFNKVCNGYSDSHLNFVLDAIKSRFNGELLPYRPQWQFRNEINYLEKHGHFVWNQEKTRGDIVYRGQVVGYYETPEHLREEKINEILK